MNSNMPLFIKYDLNHSEKIKGFRLQGQFPVQVEAFDLLLAIYLQLNWIF